MAPATPPHPREGHSMQRYVEGATAMKILGARIGPGEILHVVSTTDQVQATLGNVQSIDVKLN